MLIDFLSADFFMMAAAALIVAGLLALIGTMRDGRDDDA